jgi:hypothetical protein
LPGSEGLGEWRYSGYLEIRSVMWIQKELDIGFEIKDGKGDGDRGGGGDRHGDGDRGGDGDRQGDRDRGEMNVLMLGEAG